MSLLEVRWHAVVLILGIVAIRGAVAVLRARILRDRERNVMTGLAGLTAAGQADPAAALAVLQPHTFRSFVRARRESGRVPRADEVAKPAPVEAVPPAPRKATRRAS